MSNIVITGTIGQEPELRHVGNDGTELTTFSVAVNNYKGKGKDETTTWFKVNAWKYLASGASVLEKGYRVLVSGRLEIEEYTDKEGNKRFSNVVTADEIGVSTRFHDVTAVKRSRDAQSNGGGRRMSSDNDNLDEPF